jgi:hypothetical protein
VYFVLNLRLWLTFSLTVVWQELFGRSYLRLLVDRLAQILNLWPNCGSQRKFKMINVCTSAALWTNWKIGNEINFQGMSWTGTKTLLRRSSRMLRDRRLLHKPEEANQLEEMANELEKKSLLPPRLTLESQHQDLQSGGFEPVNSVAVPINCNSLILGAVEGLRETRKSMTAEIIYEGPLVSYIIYDGRLLTDVNKR